MSLNPQDNVSKVDADRCVSFAGCNVLHMLVAFISVYHMNLICFLEGDGIVSIRREMSVGVFDNH